MIETSAGYGRQLLSGIAQYSRLYGPWAFYSEQGDFGMALPNIGRWGADGVIARETRINKKIIELGIPVIISIDRRKESFSGIPYITTDSASLGQTAAKYFIERGFRYLAYCGMDELWWSRERGRYFADCNSKAGFYTDIYKRPKKRSERLWVNEQNIIIDWLKRLPKPTALLANSDERARHIIEACKLADLKVPEEIAVLGIDNDELTCELSDPPLSSISMNVKKAGYQAAELLDRMMSGKKIKTNVIVVETQHVVTRQSTDIIAVEDASVSKALNFIRDHSRELIQVGDVVKAANLSRNALIKRFKKVLGRSIHEEIIKVRMDCFAQMLVETNQTVSQIAAKMGYICTKHMSRCFHSQKGMTPLQYRKKIGQI